MLNWNKHKMFFRCLNIMAISVHYSCSIHFSLPQLKAMPSFLSNMLRRWTFQTSDLLLLTQLLTGSAYDEFLNQLKMPRGGYLHRLCSWTSHRPYLSIFFTKVVTNRIPAMSAGQFGVHLCWDHFTWKSNEFSPAIRKYYMIHNVYFLQVIYQCRS